MAITATPQRAIPPKEASASGATEKAVMPSIEYLNSFQTDHLVSPAARLMFSYSSHLVLKPTQPKMPFEKRLYSVTLRIASTTCRVIIR